MSTKGLLRGAPAARPTQVGDADGNRDAANKPESDAGTRLMQRQDRRDSGVTDEVSLTTLITKGARLDGGTRFFDRMFRMNTKTGRGKPAPLVKVPSILFILSNRSRRSGK